MKAVIPIAGLATRMHPLARSIPKELLPLGDLPILHRVVLELATAGVSHIILILRPGSGGVVRQYFERDPELERGLLAKGILVDSDQAWTALDSCRFSFLFQDRPDGVADAVYRAAGLVGDDVYVVHMGDSFVHNDQGLLTRMLAVHRHSEAGATIAVSWRVPNGSTSFGVAVPLDLLPSNRTEPFVIERIPKVTDGMKPTGPYVVGRYVMKGPMSEPPAAAEGGQYGGLSSLMEPAATTRPVLGVPLVENEVLLGAGTLTEYFESWRFWLSEMAAS